MLCQNCGKKTAVFHYTVNDNGTVYETHLCRDCAKKQGVPGTSDSFFDPMSFPDELFGETSAMFNGLLGELIGETAKTPTLRESAVCPGCGLRLHELIRSGKAGCAKCYTTFRDALAPSIKKLHGTTKHTGKYPVGRKKEKTVEEQRAELEALMKAAVDKQEYEKAAELRDKIKALDGGTNA